ncbi:ABC transporter substrate-binding protein [Roseovarius sp. ZX-A-9]|uniref:ABC transporter substrate-binding protein n=1 Tax=Roseovarius sp. ZX-A-9 TaxID=3014783 RepID=UPI00232B0607|nr:ABC transporter substrate-binding protein [Roseovarius sp. ZX-A-9]
MTRIDDKILPDRLAAAAREGKISRRSFINYSLAAGMTMSTATGLWGTAAKATPKRGGIFRIGQHDGSSTDSHDPGTYVGYHTIMLGHTHRSYLTMVNTDQSLGPDVATEWFATPDAKEWTFKLNPNVTFHSGRKMNAGDVLASLNHHRRETSTSGAKALLANVVDIVDNGDHSVTLKMDSPNADLPWMMQDYHLAILPANPDGTADWQSGDGTGPYKLVEHQFGVGSRLVRHEEWHGEGAYFDEVQFIVLNDPNARQTALLSGDVDAVSQLENKTLSLLARNSKVEIDNVPSASAVTMPMHCDRTPFDNVDVRMALKLAMNRKEMIEKVTYGAATLGNDFHHSSAMAYFPSDIPQREYDPDQAKFFLKKAGAEGLSVKLHVSDSVTNGAVDLCVLYAEQAKAAGININVVREPNDGYWSNVWLKKPWCLSSWGPRPTPDLIYTSTYKDDSSWNEARWKNPRFNEILTEAKSQLDDVKRAEMYREMGMIARDDGGTLIPYFPNYVYGRRSNVRHSGELSAAWMLDGGRAAQRWWFDG